MAQDDVYRSIKPERSWRDSLRMFFMLLILITPPIFIFDRYNHNWKDQYRTNMTLLFSDIRAGVFYPDTPLSYACAAGFALGVLGRIFIRPTPQKKKKS
jgi:hypothetical protein